MRIMSVFRQPDERGADAKGTSLDADFGGEVRDPLERLDELGPAVRVPAVVLGVHPDEDVRRADDFDPGRRAGQEDGVPHRA
jgi:hypothetical protein